MGLIGDWLQALTGQPEPQPQRVAARQPSPAELQHLMAQRRQAMAQTLTPERQERLAQAFAAQSARQTIDRQLRDAGSHQNMTDALRRLMADR
ncbi:MAG: hypothetical protein JNL25_01015 [Rhodospirillaceae bacterium]|nr:hypothetical protein [Rhodospirillaceae bacterium]